MGKKLYPFNALSDRVCVVAGCFKKIKKRLVETREYQNSCRCYEHFVLFENANGRPMMLPAVKKRQKMLRRKGLLI